MKQNNKVPTRKVITNEKQQSIFLDCLSDPFLRQILFSINGKPKPILMINEETKIPIRTIYRKIQILSNNNLIDASGKIRNSGKKVFLYKSRVKSITATMNNSRLKVSVIEIV